MGMGSGGKRRKAGSAGTGWQDSVYMQQCKGRVCVCMCGVQPVARVVTSVWECGRGERETEETAHAEG